MFAFIKKLHFFLQVDCTVETALCAKNEITGYPTLKFFHNKYSEVVRYKSARDLQSLQSFIEEQLSNVQINAYYKLLVFLYMIYNNIPVPVFSDASN